MTARMNAGIRKKSSFFIRKELRYYTITKSKIAKRKFQNDNVNLKSLKRFMILDVDLPFEV